INNILRKYLNIFIIAYLNDILIYLEKNEDYKNYELEFFSFIINTAGIQISLDKIKTI
ncbi:hypothetical protein K458DRAFT_320282, partial [Lentithecium fluviatile CBS 122367]